MFISDVGIDLGRGDVFVAKHFLDTSNIGTGH